MIVMENYEIRRKIGQGSFGSVHVAVERHTRATRVVKEVRTARLSDRERCDVQREVQLLSQLVHPNIVEYVESFVDVRTG